MLCRYNNVGNCLLQVVTASTKSQKKRKARKRAAATSNAAKIQEAVGIEQHGYWHCESQAAASAQGLF